MLEYLAARKQDKRGRDERRRRDNDKRKMRNERKTKEMTIKVKCTVTKYFLENSCVHMFNFFLIIHLLVDKITLEIISVLWLRKF